MNRQEKEQSIVALKEGFSGSKATFLVSYKGLTVGQMQKLRRSIREKGGELVVAKTTLMKRAVQNMQGVDTLAPYFKEQIALVFASKEAPSVAKVIRDFSKENERLGIVAGCMNSNLLSGDLIIRIASLPSREVLLAQLCGTLKAPMAKLAMLLDAIKEKKQAS